VGCSIGGDTGEFGPATAIDPGTAPCGVWSGLVVRLGGAVNTLLGPEETSPRVCGVVLGWCNATFGCHTGPRRRGVGVWWWLWGVVGWPLFENCTVDASIFVVKLPRADGGCLGTRSR
jgi:hypothetical protein